MGNARALEAMNGWNPVIRRIPCMGECRIGSGRCKSVEGGAFICSIVKPISLVFLMIL